MTKVPKGEVVQCQGCRICQVTMDGKTYVIVADGFIDGVNLSYCEGCNKNANMLVNMYAKMYGYASA